MRKPYKEGEDQQNPDRLSSVSLDWFARETEMNDTGVIPMARDLIATVDAELNDQGDYLQECETHLRMYRNLATMGTLPTRFVVERSEGRTVNPFQRRVGLNVVRPMCNTVGSKIFKNRVRAMYHTDGAGRKRRQQTKMMQSYDDGLTHQQKKAKKTRRAGLDALVMGTGYVRAFKNLGTHKKKSVEYRRIFTPQVLVNRIDGADGDPLCMYELYFENKYKLAKMYPEFADKILEMTCNWSQYQELWWRNWDRAEHSTLMVRIGYRKESYEGAGDGVYAVVLGEDLLLEHGKIADHPIKPLRWLETPDGYYGMGLCEELRGVQGEINRLMRRIQAAMILMSAPYVWIEENSNVAVDHIAGIPGTAIKHRRGAQPKVDAPNVVAPEVFAHLDRLYQRAFEIAGVSQLSATAKIPANLESGRAVLVHDDVQSDRFATFTADWQSFNVDLSNEALHWAERIDHKVKISDPTTRALTQINWSEIGVPANGWEVKVSPTSALKADPEGKMESFERMDAQGMVLSQTEKMSFFEEDPDLGAFVNRRTAARRYFENLFEGFLYDGEAYEPPDGTLPLDPELGPDSGIVIAQDIYVEALAEGVEESNLRKLTTWIVTARAEVANAKAKMQSAALPAPAPPVPPGVQPPPGLPGMPPTALTPPDSLPGMPPPLPVAA